MQISISSYRGSIRNAFTLIELLVVIAIIGLLAAIMFPVFSRARENARRASCLSNLRQIGMAAMQYSDDYDESVVPNNNGSPLRSYAEILQPYAKSVGIFVCPSDSGPRQCTALNGFKVSYALNQIYETKVDLRMFDGTYPVRMAYFQTPAETVFIGDSSSTNAETAYCFQVIDSVFNIGPPVVLGGTSQGQYEARHFEGVNWAFMDGHVKWMRFGTVTELTKVANGPYPVGSLYRLFTPQDD